MKAIPIDELKIGCYEPKESYFVYDLLPKEFEFEVDIRGMNSMYKELTKIDESCKKMTIILEGDGEFDRDLLKIGNRMEIDGVMFRIDEVTDKSIELVLDK